MHPYRDPPPYSPTLRSPTINGLWLLCAFLLGALFFEVVHATTDKPQPPCPERSAEATMLICSVPQIRVDVGASMASAHCTPVRGQPWERRLELHETMLPHRSADGGIPDPTDLEGVELVGVP